MLKLMTNERTLIYFIWCGDTFSVEIYLCVMVYKTVSVQFFTKPVSFWFPQELNIFQEMKNIETNGFHHKILNGIDFYLVASHYGICRNYKRYLPFRLLVLGIRFGCYHNQHDHLWSNNPLWSCILLSSAGECCFAACIHPLRFIPYNHVPWLVYLLSDNNLQFTLQSLRISKKPDYF